MDSISNKTRKKRIKKRQKRKEKRKQEALQAVACGFENEEVLQEEELERQRQNELWEAREREAQLLWAQTQKAAEEQTVTIPKNDSKLKACPSIQEVVVKNASKIGSVDTMMADGKHTGHAYGTEQDKINCSFYLKTGSCRFGERCGKVHPSTVRSRTLLFKNMYNGLLPFSGDDDALEHDEESQESHFRQFYADVEPEMSKFGRIVMFKVCSNRAPHLCGNVYVQYSNEEEALAASQALTGRCYASKVLKPEFVPIITWKSAICGLFQRNACSRGDECNFLHVWRNPRGEYREDQTNDEGHERSYYYDRDRLKHRGREKEHHKTKQGERERRDDRRARNNSKDGHREKEERRKRGRDRFHSDKGRKEKDEDHAETRRERKRRR